MAIGAVHAESADDLVRPGCLEGSPLDVLALDQEVGHVILVDIADVGHGFATDALARDSLIREINTVIRDGRLRNRAGRNLEQPLDGGLTNATGDLMYPIIDGIPVLVRDEAIPLAQLGHKLADE